MPRSFLLIELMACSLSFFKFSASFSLINIILVKLHVPPSSRGITGLTQKPSGIVPLSINLIL